MIPLVGKSPWVNWEPSPTATRLAGRPTPSETSTASSAGSPCSDRHPESDSNRHWTGFLSGFSRLERPLLSECWADGIGSLLRN